MSVLDAQLEAATIGITVRPLLAGDRELYLRALDRLSADTWLLRFGAPKRGLTETEVTNFLDVGHDRRAAFVAVETSTREIVGVARYAPVDGRARVVEIAVVVSDGWQGRGVGHTLVDHLLVDADHCGAVEVIASVLVDNTTVAAMLRRRGFTMNRLERGVTEWHRLLG